MWWQAAYQLPNIISHYSVCGAGAAGAATASAATADDDDDVFSFFDFFSLPFPCVSFSNLLVNGLVTSSYIIGYDERIYKKDESS